MTCDAMKRMRHRVKLIQDLFWNVKSLFAECGAKDFAQIARTALEAVTMYGRTQRRESEQTESKKARDILDSESAGHVGAPGITKISLQSRKGGKGQVGSGQSKQSKMARMCAGCRLGTHQHMPYCPFGGRPVKKLVQQQPKPPLSDRNGATHSASRKGKFVNRAGMPDTR